jgi:hypothetical protein
VSALGEVVANGPRAMLIEDALPEFDAVRREHRVVPGRRDDVWDAVCGADFLDAARGNPIVYGLFELRTVAERVVTAAQGKRYTEPPVPPSLRLRDMEERGEWVVLGKDAPREIAFGAVGHFWSGETAWEEIDAAGFAAFDRPGYARIACNFSLRPYGSDATLVTYEVRTQATDESARKAFLRYWRPLAPAIGVVLRAQLGVIATTAGA